MFLVEYLAGNRGKFIDWDQDGEASCVDLVNSVMGALYGGPRWTGNAVDIANDREPGWSWVANTPTNAPAAGDVVVWGSNYPGLSIGPYGHTAIAIAGDARALLTMDQNWPPRSPISLVVHTYQDVLGWQHRS